MLEEVSRSGHKIISVDGVALCSTNDPTQEAAAWVERNKKTLHGIETVFVLGYGAGYHVDLLAEKMPHLQVVAIEALPELLPSLGPENRILISAKNFLPWFISEKENLKSSYAVIKNIHLIRFAPALYQQIEDLLITRSASGIRSRQHDMLLEAKLLLGSKPQASVFTVKDICQRLQQRGGPYSGEERVWLALKELIT